MKILLPFSAALLSLALAACTPDGADDGAPARQSISLQGKTLTLKATGQPTAKLTADGELTVDGKPVAVNDAQRALLVAYHRELAAVADAGVATGREGAKLAGKAVGAAIKGVFSGKPDEIEQQVEREAEKVKAEALKICERLPPLYQAQQALAAALPEFRPYAHMDEADIADCREDIEDDPGLTASRQDPAAEADDAAAKPP